MRLYRALLRLFPASFRNEYGAEMSAIFARRRRDAGGGLAGLALWLETFADVLVSALRVHGDVLRQDLRFTARTLRRSPGFAAAVVGVAALGIGATTAAFSITDYVLVRPLPYPDPDRLVKLWQDPGARGQWRMEVSPANYRDWKSLSTAFTSMGGYWEVSRNLVGGGDPERLAGVIVNSELLGLLGASPALGRGFTAADDRAGSPGTVLLSHRLWRDRYGADPAVVGRKVLLDDEPYEVIGVMPPGFSFPSRRAEFWTTFRWRDRDFEERNDTYLSVLARLKPEVTLDRARAEMRLVAAQLERTYPNDNARMGARVLRIRDEVSSQARLLLEALLAASVCVLLIACTNLAGLLVARALFRRKELAVRTALGAGRDRLVRQLVTESLALASAGGVLGVLLAVAATPLALRLVPNSLPVAAAPPLDLRLLGFAALATVLTGLGFGVVPALRAWHDADAAGLREGARSGVGGVRERFRSALVVAEVSLSVVLLISAGLLIRALARVQGTDPGFRAEGVLTLQTALPLPRYESVARRHQFYSSVLGDVRALPGVSAAGYITSLPMVMPGGIWKVFIDGRPEPPGEERTASLRFVTPGYFAALRIPLRGRDVSDADTQKAPFVAVVSRALAERYWPGEDPIGRHFNVGFQDRTIVGVAGDIRVRGLERESEPQVYLPHQQVPDGAIISYTPKALVVRSTLPPAALIPDLRRIVARADPQQPISDVRPLSEIVASETAPRSVQVRVLGAFAGAAVLLAAIGIHALLAFMVSSRTQEFGVRMALGADRQEILRLVLRQGVRLAAAGVVLGLALAYAAGRALEALLAGVSPRDVATFSGAVALVLVTALVGSLLPARAAARVDPLTAMRTE